MIKTILSITKASILLFIIFIITNFLYNTHVWHNQSLHHFLILSTILHNIKPAIPEKKYPIPFSQSPININANA